MGILDIIKNMFTPPTMREDYVDIFKPKETVTTIQKTVYDPIKTPLSAPRQETVSIPQPKAKKKALIAGVAPTGFYESMGRLSAGQEITDVNDRFERGVYPKRAAEFVEYQPRGILTKGTQAESTAKQYMQAKAAVVSGQKMDEWQDAVTAAGIPGVGGGGALGGDEEGGGLGIIVLIGAVALGAGLLLKRKKKTVGGMK